MKIRAKISFSAFQRGQTIYELFLMQIIKSFTDIAERKKRELDRGEDHLEIYSVNDDTFQRIIDGSVSNIFKDIIALNQHKLKENLDDEAAYKKLKYSQAVVNLQRGKDFVEVKDKFGIIKVREIDNQANIEKAGHLYSMLNKVRASDMFLGVVMRDKEQGNDNLEKGAEDDQAKMGTDHYSQLLKYKQRKDILEM